MNNTVKCSQQILKQKCLDYGTRNFIHRLWAVYICCVIFMRACIYNCTVPWLVTLTLVRFSVYISEPSPRSAVTHTVNTSSLSMTEYDGCSNPNLKAKNVRTQKKKCLQWWMLYIILLRWQTYAHVAPYSTWSSVWKLFPQKYAKVAWSDREAWCGHIGTFQNDLSYLYISTSQAEMPRKCAH